MDIFAIAIASLVSMGYLSLNVNNNNPCVNAMSPLLPPILYDLPEIFKLTPYSQFRSAPLPPLLNRPPYFQPSVIDLQWAIYLHNLYSMSPCANYNRRRPRGTRAGAKRKRKIKCVTPRRPALSSSQSNRGCVRSNLVEMKTTVHELNRQNVNETPVCTHLPVCREKHSKDKVKIMYFNGQSLRNKATLVCDMITDIEPDLVFITETWLFSEGDEVILQEATPTGYSKFNEPRYHSRGGGICIIYKDSTCTLKINKSSHTFNSFEYLELIAFNTTFVCIYHPPPSKENKITQKMFQNDYLDLIEKATTSTKRFIHLGDFNIHFDDQTASATRYMKTLLSNHNSTQIIETPTHSLGHILDWVVTNTPTFITDIKVKNILLTEHRLKSYHYIITFCLNLRKPPMQEELIESRNIRSIDIERFNQTINDAIEARKTAQCIDLVNAELYNDILKTALDEHAPLKTRSVVVRPSAPWRTDTVIKAKQQQRATERRWRKTKLLEDKIRYENSVKHLKQTIIHEKKQHLNEKIENCKTTKALFAISNELKGVPKSSPLPKNISPNDLPDQFGQFFTNKVLKIRNDLDIANFSSAPKIDENEVSNNIFQSFSCFKEVSISDVKKLILSSPPKSCSLDPIPTALLLKCLDCIAPLITDVINNSLSTGVVPDCFKSALVSPLLKKHNLDPEDLKNFRPVSNLPFVSKILEKAVLLQLQEHLQVNNLLETFQSAYRAQHSTESALLKITNDILLSCDAGKFTILALLDLSAAFDTVDHDVLLHRLAVQFGITDTVLSWFQSYLSNRNQSIFIKKKMSSVFPVVHGVPQGSVLGPILYTLYTISLSDAIKKHDVKYHMYADDIQLYKDASLAGFDELKADIEACSQSIKSWMTSNMLKLNGDKTEILICSTDSKIKKLDSNLEISIADSRLSFSNSAKNLGVILDSTLSMSAQIDYTVRVIYLELRKISQMKCYLTSSCLKTLVVSLVLSRLDYCNSLYAGLTDASINKLQRAQNCAARLVLGKTRMDCRSNDLLRILHWLPVRARIEYKICLFCFRALESGAPEYINDLLLPYEPPRTLRSHGARLLSIPKTKLKTFGDRSFAKIGPEMWNTLPASVRQAESLLIFKKALKTHLFKKYL